MVINIIILVLVIFLTIVAFIMGCILYKMAKSLDTMEANLVNELITKEPVHRWTGEQTNEIVNSPTEDTPEDNPQEEEIKEQENVFTFVEDALTGKRDLYE